MKHILMGCSVVLIMAVAVEVNSWFERQSQPVIYRAQASEKKEEIQIVTKIQWTEARIKKEIRETFPEEPETMIQVAWCESRLHPEAVGPTDDHGIFQLHNPSHDLSGVDVYDPKENIAFARKLYEQMGKTPWTASEECWYNP